LSGTTTERFSQRSFKGLLVPRFCLLIFVSALARISLAAEAPPPAPVWSSIDEVWQGETLAGREWNDEHGERQGLTCCRRKDGVVFYLLHALSAVCGDAGKESSCKIHCFDACFDELGRFQGLRVDGAQPFTRAKHEPFGPKDYELLDHIVRDPVHVIGSIGTQTKGVDAISGATIAYLAEKSVPGAFYTTRAVWIIAQRSAPERIQAWTLERLTADDVKAWRAKGEALKLWWFLDNAGKSPLSGAVKADLAYELLTCPQPEVQSAAIRCLQRAGAAFQPARSRGDAYAKLDDAVKPAFLAWWLAQHHAPDELVTAVLDDLAARAAQRSAVTVPALEYLAALGAVRSERAREVLKTLAEKSPSTFVRGKAEELLKPTP
jgi:hypothetical protein